MQRTWYSPYIGIIFFVGIVVVFHFLGWTRPFQQTVHGLIEPILQRVHALTTSPSIAGFNTYRELEQAYQKLAEESARKTVDVYRLQELERENQSLRNQLQFFSTFSLEGIGADVIGKDQEQSRSGIIINAGSEQDVHVGDPVIAEDGILVGIVSEVFDSFSNVVLINDNESRIGATVANQDRSLGSVEGGFGISIRMTLIPQNETVISGDTIVTSNISPRIPPGLLIGTVESVEKEAYQPFQEAVVSPLADLQHLEHVSVLKYNREI